MENEMLVVDESASVKEKECGCKDKNERKFRLGLELEMPDKGTVENASQLSEVLIYLANFPDIRVKSFNTYQW